MKQKKTEKFYIVWYKSITQYNITNSGYYVSYKDKLSDNYSDNFVFAKRYKTLAPALTRAGIWDYKGTAALRMMKLIEEGKNPFPDNSRIEVVRIDNMRKRKISKLNGESGDPIRNLGPLPTEEFYEFLRKQAKKFYSSSEGKYYQNFVPEKDATPEDIDDFCSHMDNVMKNE